MLKNIVKAVNHTLYATNLVKEGNSKILLDLNDLHKKWKEKAEIQREVIAKLTKTDWEAYWQYLFKPHSQIMTLNFSLHSTQWMFPPLTNVIFAGHVKTYFGAPPQVKPMADICDLKEKLADMKSSS